MRAVILAACVACGGAAPPAEQHPSPLPSPSGALIADPCWPIAVMQIVEVDHPIAEMSGDGSMTRIRPDERQFLGRVSNDAVLDAHEMPSLTCIRKQVEMPGTGLRGHYDAEDAYVDPETRVFVGDDGAITLTLGKHPPETLRKLRVVGPAAKYRRTAELLVVSLLTAR